MKQGTKQALISYLSQFISDHKLQLFNTVIKARTRYITVVLEDIYQSQNASAVLRTCDGLGIQDIHIIENYNTYKINPDITLGAAKWLTLKKYNDKKDNTIRTIRKLKGRNYRIIATSSTHSGSSLESFDITEGQTAILLGNELNGLSETAKHNADELIYIPMYGFTESFNISVSTAVLLYQLTNSLRNSKISWKITPKEQEDILFEWLRRSIKNCDSIIKKYLTDYC